MRGEPAVELAGQGLGAGQRPGPLRLGLFCRLRQSSSHVGFRIALEGLSGFLDARQLRPISVTLCNVIPVYAELRRVTNAPIRALGGGVVMLGVSSQRSISPITSYNG
ncbi:hypothetical protein Ari01nite_65890 [Paractinoplanes rishiriensis]|uniref:Uncharacterized protein n=1 Tax=Paractinoplanes rishiriensis TaxID=1050105 RepID=A0A919K5I5_9ACTN|nr:hypothetical protein Ari01nite_65890 [Actinoplanes rishiriensis]